ncbi:hypothetical protein Hanom_Chr07g00622011 [Helianthus anomalus]
MKRNWKIQVQLFGSKYSVTDELGHKYEFIDPNAPPGAAKFVEIVDEEDEDEPVGPRGPKQRMEKFVEEQQLFQALQRSQMKHMVQKQQQEMARRRAWEKNKERLQIEQNTREERRWSAMYIPNELAINNAKVLHDQERHRKD